MASWASVDSFGRYKALHYAARKFYAPVAMGLFLENGKLVVNISDETMTDFRGTIRLYKCHADLTVLDEKVRNVEVDALSSADVYSYKITCEDPYSTYFYVDLYDESGAFLMRQVEMLVPAKHFEWIRPNITAEFTDTPEGVEITVRTDAFTKGVYIDFTDQDCVL